MLFKTNNIKEMSIDKFDYLTSPYGLLETEISVGNTLIEISSPNKCYDLNGNAILYLWEDEEYQIQLIQGEIKDKLDSFVDACYANIWRFKVHQLAKIFIRYKFIPKIKIEYTGLESSEGFESIAWSNDEIKIALGTEDDISLINRLENELFIPDYWMNWLETDGINMYYITPHSLNILFPPLNIDDIFQCHYVFSWSKNTKIINDELSLPIQHLPQYLLTALGAKDDMSCRLKK